jgi:hypothetical protein
MYRHTRIAAFACVALVLAAATPRLQSQGSRFGGGSLAVFDDVDFEGASETIRNDVPDLRALRFNDRISSLRAAAGEFWEVCSDTNFEGRCIVVSGGERDLRSLGMNDAISSLRRVEGPRGRYSVADGNRRGGLVVCDDVNFEGATLTLARDIPDLREVQFNDRISSLRVPPGESWEVCEDTNYQGRCMVFSRPERDLRGFGFNDSITSLRRADGPGDRRDRGRP